MIAVAAHLLASCDGDGGSPILPPPRWLASTRPAAVTCVYPRTACGFDTWMPEHTKSLVQNRVLRRWRAAGQRSSIDQLRTSCWRIGAENVIEWRLFGPSSAAVVIAFSTRETAPGSMDL